MKKTLSFIVAIFLIVLQSSAQSGSCLMGDCKDSLSLLKKLNTFTLSSTFNSNKHDHWPGKGNYYEFNFGNANEASIWQMYSIDGKQKQHLGQHLAFITESSMQVYISANSYAMLADGAAHRVQIGVAEYDGTFVNNKPDGKGILEYDYEHRLAQVMRDSITLLRYVGDFKNGYPNGNGRLYYTNGRSDTVVFDNGVLVSPERPDLECFKGGCISGNCDNGWGTYVWNHSRVYKYTGVFQHGEPRVFGIFQYMNGELYMGELNDSSQYDGIGCLWHYPYMQENGVFKDGEYVEGSGYVHDDMNRWSMTNYLAHSPDVIVPPGKCSMCLGKGKIDDGICKTCRGRGTYKMTHYLASDNIVKTEEHSDGSKTIYYEKQGYSSSIYDCGKCNGTGRRFITCPQCNGTGIQ